MKKIHNIRFCHNCPYDMFFNYMYLDMWLKPIEKRNG